MEDKLEAISISIRGLPKVSYEYAQETPCEPSSQSNCSKRRTRQTLPPQHGVDADPTMLPDTVLEIFLLDNTHSKCLVIWSLKE